MKNFINCIYRFPKDDSRKQEWMQALGFNTPLNYKTAYVCSAHFEDDCYGDVDDQRTRKRLLSTAVPHIERIIESKTMEDSLQKGSSICEANVNRDESTERVSTVAINEEINCHTNSEEDDMNTGRNLTEVAHVESSLTVTSQCNGKSDDAVANSRKR